MNYTDRSHILRGLSKFPGVNLDGCIKTYNAFYDTYLDRARLIYGDTDVTDVTPASVNSTLRSRYIASIEQYYQGRDQFVAHSSESIPLGISLDAIPLFASIAPVGPRDLACIIYGSLGDGLDIDGTTLSGFVKIVSATILSDSVWGHTFTGEGESRGDKFWCHSFSAVAIRPPLWVEGSSQHSCSVYPCLYKNTIMDLYDISFRIRNRTPSSIVGYEIRIGTSKRFDPIEVSSSKRYTFLKFQEESKAVVIGSSATLEPVPAGHILSADRFATASDKSDSDELGNFIIQDSLGRVPFYCTAKDYYALVSAALLNAAL